MKLTITPTDDGFTLPGLCDNQVAGRIWDGVTEKGTKVRVFVMLVAVPDEAVESVEAEFGGKLVAAPVEVAEPLDPQRN